MLFNSTAFAVFFPIVVALAFATPPRSRWMVLLAASCLFYAWFIPAYLLVLALTITVDYWAALKIEAAAGVRRRVYFALSIVVTCAILFVFKYYAFFASVIADLAGLAGRPIRPPPLGLALPIGLSFHTLQSLSYVVEVYRGTVVAERHLGIYALYVMFFPQLVAGPIERPDGLLPQLRAMSAFRYGNAAAGLRRMAWGFFKKLVIADRIAPIVDLVYGNSPSMPGIALGAATVAFAFQIYCDFSGYSDIAIGAAQVLGVRLRENFNRPYSATSIGDFWRRWHMSLSTWLRDYIYFPLGGSRTGRLRHYRNLLLTFFASGLWHGANWTFVVWGGIHGGYLVLADLVAPVRLRFGAGGLWRQSPRSRAGLRQVSTFALVCVGWVFFRAPSLRAALLICGRIFIDAPREVVGLLSGARWATLGAPPVGTVRLVLLAVSIAAMLVVEYAGDNPQSRLNRLMNSPTIRWALYQALIAAILFFGIFHATQFIYFQF